MVRTEIGARRVHTVRGRGGNKKYRALRLDVGNFSWGSECQKHPMHSLNPPPVLAFFYLPNYPNAKVCEEKLRYAAYNCVVIDTDMSPWEE